MQRRPKVTSAVATKATSRKIGLGTVLRDLRRLEEAWQYFAEVLRIRRRLEEGQPGGFLPQVAGTLNNLGTILHNLCRLEEARQHCTEALRHYRRLEEGQPSVFLP